MKRILIVLLRWLADVSPGWWGLRMANAIRIRPRLGWMLDQEVETSYFDVRLKVNCREWHGFYIHVGRCYEKNVLELLRRRGGRYGVFFDVGANLGVHSLVFARHHPFARVVGFEPMPDLFVRFQKNIRLNPGIRNIDPLPVALWNRTGLQRFNPGDDDGNRGIGTLMGDGATDGSCNLHVPCYTMTEVGTELSLWPELVKIDVEGAELQVLEGMTRAFGEGKGKPDLILEFHGWMFGEGGNAMAGRLMEFFRKWQYHVWLLDETSGDRTLIQGDAPLPARALLLASAEAERFSKNS